MRLGLYQQETAHIAAEQASLFEEAQQRLRTGEGLSRLEQNGVLHALQILIENAKAAGEPVPVSAYDSFAVLARLLALPPDELARWHAAVGLRNRIVHGPKWGQIYFRRLSPPGIINLVGPKWGQI